MMVDPLSASNFNNSLVACCNFVIFTVVRYSLINRNHLNMKSRKYTFEIG